ncbi:MAG: DUF3558 domain-containing protein [Chloroflexi bacterium]|nr:DUF3558 domain-containing protein [Chloroflexota bacterium]
MKTRIEIRLFFLVGLILTLGLAACTSDAETPEAESPQTEIVEESEATSAPEGGAAEVTESEGDLYYGPADGGTGSIVIDATDACTLLTQEQVAAAFGKDVVEVSVDTQTIGAGCEYKFDSEGDTQVQVTIYEGDAAKHYFAGIVQAAQESCDAMLEKFFDIEFLAAPDSGQDVSGLSLGDLYTTYVGTLGNCMFVQNATRSEVGDNVVTAETIYLNWSSNVAVLGDERVVEFTYQEPIPDEVNAELQAGTDRDSFYALAQPYRDTILAGYTESLIALLEEATGQ